MTNLTNEILKKAVFISVLILLGSCKTSKIPDFLDSNNVLVAERYYVINYNQPDKANYTEKEVKQIDSVTNIKNEFQKLTHEITVENKDSEIDTISKYKLKFISENHKSENVGRASTQTNLLKKCDQYVKLKYFIKTPEFVNSYSKKYLIVYSIPIIEHGDTYVSSSITWYYFERIKGE